jgi:hypothetical protein
MKKITGLLIILATVSMMTSCRGILNCEEGNGNVEEYTVNIADFKNIEVRGSGMVKVYNAPTNGQMILEVDENLRQYIEITNSGNTLVLDVDDDVSICPTRLEFRINTEYIEGIEIDGSADFILADSYTGIGDFEIDIDGSGDILFDENVEVASMDIDIDGSGDIMLEKVTCTDGLFEIDIDGSGKLKTGTVSAQYINIDTDGSGNTILDIDCEELSIDIAGSGDVYASGNFVSARTQTAGSGDISMQDAEGKSCDCEIIGSGNMRVRVTENLNGKIIGSGDIYLWGNPPNIDISILGSGELYKR